MAQNKRTKTWNCPAECYLGKKKPKKKNKCGEKSKKRKLILQIGERYVKIHEYHL